ncbi:DNA-binding CsgD family transcriptional regulator OS=Leifsonia shinshuensis OX=150026 GN=HNR13_001073 PE=4 SV=1 [Leifsonia shinshuensis]
MGMLDDVRSGASRVAVVSGDAGCGKTALLERCTALARGFRVVSIAGVQSERELAFAGLQQLCTPLLSRLGALPETQAAALRVTLCLEQGPVPDRLLVGLAFLSLLAEAAAERPLLCVVDDEQWIDRASAEVLSFAGRRLNAESVGLLFGTRALRPELSGFPHEPLRPLDDLHAGALLSSVLPFKMDRRIREQIVSDAHGNPLALIELSRDIRAGQLSGGYGLPKALRTTAGADEVFRRRIRKLPRDSATLLVLAAAESTGDVVLFWRAAEQLGVHSDAVTRSSTRVSSNWGSACAFGTRWCARSPIRPPVGDWSAMSMRRWPR